MGMVGGGGGGGTGDLAGMGMGGRVCDAGGGGRLGMWVRWREGLVGLRMQVGWGEVGIVEQEEVVAAVMQVAGRVVENPKP